MTSEPSPREAYVWIWLPGATAPVVAGRLARDGGKLVFNYGRSYLERPGAIPIYEPELPLRRGAIPPGPDLGLAGCLRDAAPDAWGRRVIINRTLGLKGKDIDLGSLDELTYLLESGSDRIGALDFQASPTVYVPRPVRPATLQELLTIAARIEAGEMLTPELDQALFHGSSIGGARPKGMFEDHDRKFVAKFSSTGDTYSVVKAEFVAMRLAARAGLEAAPVRLEMAQGTDVLLVERFARRKVPDGWRRKALVSALTLFGFDEMLARYASYETLAEIIRHRFAAPRDTLRELFGRLVFNVLCGNTDDHARNHAAFWDGASLALTPAYDICPQNRTGNEATQAMRISGDTRASTLAACLEAAPHFLLDAAAAAGIIAGQIAAIQKEWDAACQEANLTETDQALLRRRMFLNPYIFQGAPDGLRQLGEAWAGKNH